MDTIPIFVCVFFYPPNIFKCVSEPFDIMTPFEFLFFFKSQSEAEQGHKFSVAAMQGCKNIYLWRACV